MAEGAYEPRGRVLVVDDEMHLRLFIKAVFESAGFAVRTAKDGEEGLRELRSFRPHLVSLDLMMPGQGGLRLLTGLRADPELAGTPVLVVSAIEDQTFRQSLALLGDAPAPDGYVEKPPSPQAILREAERILHGQPKEA